MQTRDSQPALSTLQGHKNSEKPSALETSECQSYHCRERWELGAREDWRYADMRKRYGSAWPLASFFLVYLIQQGMLVGLTLPLYAVFSSRRVWQPVLDSLATAGCLAGNKVCLLL